MYERPNRELTGATFSWLFWAIAIVVVLSLVLGVVGWGLGWLGVPGQVVSPQNVREQWRFSYEHDESLQTAARNVCLTETALAASTSDTERVQRQSQLLAYQQVYTKIQAQYNARLRNAFEAGLVRPRDVPEKAPELSDMKLRVCSP